MPTLTYTTATGLQQTITLGADATAAQQTAAIQSALDTVADHGGGTVSLSEGTWTLTGTGKAADGCLKIGSHTTLEGAGSGQTVLKLADGSGSVTGIVRTDSGRTLPDGTFTTVTDVTVKGLTIDGNRANTTGDVDGFYCGPKPGTAQADTDIRLEGVEILNCSRYGFDPHERTVGLTFTACIAHDNGADGFTIDACSNVRIVDCAAYDNGRHGFNIVTGSHDVTMIGNDAYDNGGSGISIQTGDNEVRSWTEHVTISGGTLADNGRTGIEAKQTGDLSISGVAIAGNGMDGVILSGVVGASLADLSFAGNGGSGAVRLGGYLQDFDDDDALNDRWISSTDVTLDGVALVDTSTSSVALWDHAVSDGDDDITGSLGRDVIAAGSGDDQVEGRAGSDVLFGNDGNDTLDGGDGDDRLYGQQGDDRLVWSGGLDLMDGGAGFDTIEFAKGSEAVAVDLGGGGYEAMQGTIALADLVSIEGVRGTSSGDRLVGNALANVLDGGGGADTLAGAGGDDTLTGGGGNDRLTGGAGRDVMTGGTGSDHFVFAAGSGADTITDFTKKQDKIVVSGLSGYAALGISAMGSDTLISFGADSVLLKGVAAESLGTSDFLFT
jgi:Ca2+-binding RTX toxin-like protein